MEMPARRFNSLAVGVRPSLRAAALRAAMICCLLRALVLGIAGGTHLSLGLESMFKKEITGKPGTARQRRPTDHFIARIKYEFKSYICGRSFRNNFSQRRAWCD